MIDTFTTPSVAPLDLGNAPRTSTDVLISIAQLLEESLVELRHVRHALDQPSESRSSCTVKTSTRSQDLEVHSYNDGVLPGAVNEAISEYARGIRALQVLQANQWQESVEALRKDGAR